MLGLKLYPILADNQAGTPQNWQDPTFDILFRSIRS